MEVRKLKDYKGGWFMGDFNPSVWKGWYFEVAVLHHKKNEVWPKHYHKIADEYNVLLDGHMTICGQEIFKDDIFILKAGEVADPVFHEDCRVLCIKIPSDPKDKYEVI